MGTLQKTVIRLQAKKQEASKIRRQTEKQLKNAKSTLRRSKSGLASADRRIESAREELSDVSLVLSQKSAQKDSILRLIGGAEQRLGQERDAKGQAEQDAEFADTDDERLAAQRRLHGILERISDIELEIKNRKKTAKKLEDEISSCSASRDRISSQIKKTSQTRPELRKLLRSSTKDSDELSVRMERSSRQEINAKRSLKRAEERLKDQLSKKPSSPKKTAPRTPRAVRKTKTPSPKKTAPRTPRAVRKTKPSSPKKTTAKKATKKSRKR